MSVRTLRNSLPLLTLNFKKNWYEYFGDDFEDSIRNPAWTDEPNFGTITESGGVLTLAVAAGIDGDFWCGIKRAPIAYLTAPASKSVIVETKLNSYTVNDKTRAGIYITDIISGSSGVHFGRVRTSTGAQNGIALIDMCGVVLNYAAVTTLPIWLKVEIQGSGIGSEMVFKYSINGTVWTTFYSHSNEDWNYIGLAAWNWTLDNAISAPFEYFLETPYQIETENLAPIDTRASTVFYDGRIKQISTLKRAVDDKTGLFQIADISITLANEDKHYSQKLASQFLKNQEAVLYHAWTEEPEANKTHVITLIVEDYSMKGPDFIIKFKDTTQKYFTKKIPEHICTSDDFPDIHPDHEGRCMPEILGNASLSAAYEHPGAVEAVYVDTAGPPYRCLASAGLITIPTDEVWIGDVQKTEGVDYTVVYSGGRTYIHFVAGQDPGDEAVTFNAQGYSVPAWDSVNGYIQNLAYIIQYFLEYLMEIPSSLIDATSFATLADYYEEMGVSENCYLIIQDREDAMEIFRQLLFTGGAKGFMAIDGKFNVARKNLCNWQVTSVNRHLFEQTDLFDSPDRKWNLTSAVNTINAQFGYIPWQNFFTGTKKAYRDNRFEKIMEDDIIMGRRERMM